MNKGGVRKRTGDQSRFIAQDLREKIIQAQLLPEAVLRQETLAADYGVSRMPVREALQILQKEGWVDIVPNAGTVITALNIAELTEVYEMRAALEVLALSKALPEISNSQLEAAKAILEQAQQAPRSAFGELNHAFHNALYAPCKRPRLLAQIGALATISQRYLHTAAIQLDYEQQSHHEHQRLLELCFDRDIQAATLCLRQHIETAGKALAAQL
ncbi:HTH-type transcriptional repressor CsiR [Pseudovibrio axinellae]|uniref:HTH-type transcriptional repressor CsiR n=2 Tax=Pseudovibrio axinellae TaxID=989403 RepID=A0A165Z0N5_9HYPH|nr:HTH-type transcriptional repressor CsiR [Pseudovibrio axinellae]SER59061.1 transcriptional regulator, GntR family [Pseudovibrio axinellae]